MLGNHTGNPIFTHNELGDLVAPSIGNIPQYKLIQALGGATWGAVVKTNAKGGRFD